MSPANNNKKTLKIVYRASIFMGQISGKFFGKNYSGRPGWQAELVNLLLWGRYKLLDKWKKIAICRVLNYSQSQSIMAYHWEVPNLFRWGKC